MEKLDGMPNNHAPPPESAKSQEKKNWLYTCVFEILDKFVMGDMDVTSTYQRESMLVKGY